MRPTVCCESPIKQNFFGIASAKSSVRDTSLGKTIFQNSVKQVITAIMACARVYACTCVEGCISCCICSCFVLPH